MPAVDPADTDGVMQVRALTPTREFVLGTGALPAEQRRNIADTAQCLKCHVGSLYQHGGNRVDNVEMCIICHNPASNEQNVRAGMNVDTTDAYDGKNGQTYEFKTMLHAIHSAGEKGAPDRHLPEQRHLRLGPGRVAAQELAERHGQPAGVRIGRRKRQPRDADPQLPHADVSAAVERLRRLPRRRFWRDSRPVQGGGDHARCRHGRVADQLDDTLQGASAAACTSCHQSTDTKGHAYQNGWVPSKFENGRQTILDTK